jgi:hypothetical protein
MRYLAISKSTTFFSYSIFEDEVLVSCNIITLKEFDSVLRIKEIYKNICDLILKFEPSVVVTHSLEVQKILKKDLEKITEMKTAIKLACIELKVLYLEAKTSGWEKYILEGKVTSNKKKVFLATKYGFMYVSINKNHCDEIANSVILGEAVAHKRLHA